MSPAQHTKGPWLVVPPLKNTGGSVATIATDRVFIAHVADLNLADTTEEDANTHLIAAAPELLAALEMILAESDHDGYGARTDAQIPRLRAALGTARAAIAKAKGGAA